MEDYIVDILLVEDRPEDAELTIMGLKSHNLINKIDWVKDGEEALDYLYARGKYSSRDKKSLPKLVLLDLHMPKINGMEVLKIIKEDDSLKHIPVIILTTSKEEQDVVHAYDFHVNAYILKPVDFDGFAVAMKALGMFWGLLNQRPY